MTAGRWLKLRRGEKHLQRLDDEIEAFVAPSNRQPIDVVQQFDGQHEEWVVTVTSVQECPEHWGLLAGESIQNLRAALDHLIWDLSILDFTKVPVDKKGRPWRTQFPICGHKDDWESANVREMVRPLSPVHRATLKGLQPYHGWNGPRVHPLLALNDLSNTDKHRVLKFTYLNMSSLEASFVMEHMRDCQLAEQVARSSGPRRPVKVGTELFRMKLRVTGPEPYMDVKFKSSMYIGLSDGTPIRETLRQIATFVGHEVLPRFEADLTTPAALELREKIDNPPAPPLVADGFRMDAIDKAPPV